MQDKVFFDSNIIIYLYSEDEIEKIKFIKEIILNNTNIISTQVINELCNIFKRKFKIDYEKLLEILNEIENSFEIYKINLNTIKYGINISKKYDYSYYDSLIIAQALENNCSTLYSEDLQHKQIIEKTLKIINPFK